MGNSCTRFKPPRFLSVGISEGHCVSKQSILKTIPELKAAIAAKIREIPREECARVIDNFA